MSTETKNKKQPKITGDMLDTETITKMIDNKSCSVKRLSESMGCSPNDMKIALLERFGNKIAFKRGRNGGVVWAK